MSDLDERKRWRTTRVEAYLWYCGDEDCDCTQPRIDRVTPNLVAGYPWIQRELLWEGEFLTNTLEYSEEERERRQFAPARAACLQLDTPIPEDFGSDTTGGGS